MLTQKDDHETPDPRAIFEKFTSAGSGQGLLTRGQLGEGLRRAGLDADDRQAEKLANIVGSEHDEGTLGGISFEAFAATMMIGLEVQEGLLAQDLERLNLENEQQQGQQGLTPTSATSDSQQLQGQSN